MKKPKIQVTYDEKFNIKDFENYEKISENFYINKGNRRTLEVNGKDIIKVQHFTNKSFQKDIVQTKEFYENLQNQRRVQKED